MSKTKQAFLLIWIVGFCLYFRSLFFGFTYLDENVLILDNLKFLQNWSNIRRAFTQEVFFISHSSAAYYRPLLTISFMFDSLFSGTSPFMYHLSNIILHLAASSLVYKLLTKLKYNAALSLFLALVFTVHPVLTQAVAWLPGRNDSLLTVFVLGGFIFLLRYLEKRRWYLYMGQLLLFAAALFTKETALVMPVVFGFYLIFVGKVREVGVFLKLFIGWGIVVVPWYLLRRLALKDPISMTVDDVLRSLWENLPALVQFMGKIFFPFNLSVLPIMQDTTFVWGVAGLGILSILVFLEVWQGKTWRPVFGIVWFLAFLLPSFIRPNPTLVADFIEHRIYLPLFGIFIILAQSKALQSFNWQKLVYKFGGLTVLGIFALITFWHSGNFANRLVFWKNAAANSPHSPLGQRNLGAMYYLAGQPDLAEVYYKKSLALNEYEPMVHNNLGLIYAGRGEYVLAEEEYKKELSFNKDYDNAHFNLGLLYYKLGRLDEAKQLWEKTLEINPDYSDAYQALKVLEASK